LSVLICHAGGKFSHWQKKPSSSDEKMAAVYVWKAKLPIKAIRNQLQFPKATLRRILMLPRTV
jgi:hypothetical protein